MRDEKTIDELVKAAVLEELDGVEFLQDFDCATLCREYNGIGPEWAGERIRAVATRYLDLFQPAAVVHDMRNYVSDGSSDRFHYANMEFLVNCLKLANAAYPWYSWRRYRAHAIAIALYDFVEGEGGWRAWLDCHERNLSRKERRERKESL